MYLTAVSGNSEFPVSMIFTLLIIVLFWGVRITIAVLLIKALLKYLRDQKDAKENTAIRKSLSEVLKGHRMRCAMTQEFVAEALGVSRQAVSKWENGTAEPSTSNLLKIAKLYGITAEELIHSISADPD